MESTQLSTRLLQEFAAHSIEIGPTIYSANRTVVYRGTYRSSDAAVKVVGGLTEWQSRYFCAESQRHGSLASAHIVEVYDSFRCEEGGSWHFVSVMEWMETDLAREINRRKQGNEYWEEARIWTFARELIDTLANLQQDGLAHRDLKPANIFLTSEQSIKIGDFGSSRVYETFQSNTSESTRVPATRCTAKTVIGTPLFMSPELKKLMFGGASCATYNPFKSDVYSLGITLLTCCRLQVSFHFMEVSRLEGVTVEALSSVTDVCMRQLLAYMLTVDPNDRPDFLQLQKYISESHEPPIDDSTVACCAHIAPSRLYSFPCHGRFCDQCVSVSSIEELPNFALEKVQCPKCNSKSTYYYRPCSSQPKTSDFVRDEGTQYSDSTRNLVTQGSRYSVFQDSHPQRKSGWKQLWSYCNCISKEESEIHREK